MKRSNNKVVNMVLNYIGEERLEEIDDYVAFIKHNAAVTFNTPQDVRIAFHDYMRELYDNTKYEDVEKIRYYTGVSYNKINGVLRDKWDYEKNGILTDDIVSNMRQIADDISETIKKSPGLADYIKTYRGASLSSFKDYGVTTLNDLKDLVGQYIYERGFTSTSLIRENSFFDRKLEYHSPCNIEIEYLIPKESNEGIPLTTQLLSYSSSQNEYLINKGSLSKIVDVVVDETENKAYLKAVLIPKRVWDLSYQEQLKNNSK